MALYHEEDPQKDPQIRRDLVSDARPPQLLCEFWCL